MRLQRLLAGAAAAAIGIGTPLVSATAAHADSDGYLIGHVVDTAGHPVGGITVTATYTGNSSSTSSTGTSDRLGRYVLRIDNATVTSVAPSDSDYTGSAVAGTWKLPSDGNVAGPTLKVSPNANPAPSAYALTGTVVGASGRPAHGAWVYAYTAAGEWAGSAQAGADGRYYFTSLPAGRYKLESSANDTGWVDADASPNSSIFWYGGRSFASAATVAVGSKTSIGALVVATGTLTGTITLPKAVNGWQAQATLYDADGNVIDSNITTDATGFFSADVVAGTYYLSASGETYDSTGSPDQQEKGMITQWWHGGFSPATATPVVVRPNATVSGLNFALGRTILAITAPHVSGKLKLHKRLTASTGSWNHRADVVFRFVWRRGGTVVGTGPTYQVGTADVKAVKKLRKADTKKQRKKAKKYAKRTQLTVTVTASDALNNLAAGAVTAKAPTARSAAKAGGKGHHHGKGHRKHHKKHHGKHRK